MQSECNTDPKVLFVDDEPNVLRALSRLFSEIPLRVITAGSGEAALQALRVHSDMSVIVSDHRMPSITGVEFLEQAKTLCPDAIRMLLTGYTDVNTAIESINRGAAFRYISKPWDDEELVQVVREAADRHGLVVENRRLTEIVREQNQELKRWSAELQYYVQEQTLDIEKKNETLQGLNKRLRKNFKDTITAFSKLIELRDGRARGHSKAVAELAHAIAVEAGIGSEERELIVIGALLHDIGKIGISDLVLVKTWEQMEDKEKREYMKHPVRGQTAIDTIEDLRNVGVIIRHHHEWVNGQGFPDGLKGDQIPLESNEPRRSSSLQ